MSGQSAFPKPLPVLITRPQPQASRFAAALAQAEPLAAPIIAPLMRTEYLSPSLPAGPFSALILTSEPGAIAAGSLLKQSLTLPKAAFCVGQTTAATAQAQGLTVRATAPTAQALADTILALPDPGPLLWLRGADYRAELPSRLALTQLETYRQAPCPLPEPATKALSRPGPLLITLFSPRSAALLAAALPKTLQAKLLPIAISPSTAEALPESFAAVARIAETPDAPGMIAAIRRGILSLAP